MSTPVIYTFGLSVWAAAPQLAIEELGYSEGAIKKEIINLAEGANFHPDFVKINPNATLPTLVAGEQTFTNTDAVIKYLVQNAPKKVTPGTAFIQKIHDDKYDPNLPLLIARNEDELKAQATGFARTFAQNRQDALAKYSATPEAAPFKAFYDAKLASNGGVLAVYNGAVPESAKQGFFDMSTAHWNAINGFILNELPALLPESGFLGGAQPGEDDFHLAAWLARIGMATGATKDKDGYKALEKELKQPVPAKVANYWAAWSVRPSWAKVYSEGLH